MPLDVVKSRDPKGLYAKVAQGLIKGFTGIDAPYEPPLSPELTLKTHELTIEQARPHPHPHPNPYLSPSPSPSPSPIPTDLAERGCPDEDSRPGGRARRRGGALPSHP